MRKIVIPLILVLLFTACNFSSKHPGYSKTWSGIYYKLLTLGETDRKAIEGDYITIDISYKTLKDSVFFTGHRKLQLTKPDFEGSIDECFTMLNKNEKGEFIIGTNDFFARTLQSPIPSFLKKDKEMKVEIQMLDIQTTKDYENQKKAFLKWIEDFGDYEKEILSQYINEKKIAIPPTPSGIYYLKMKAGDGRKVKLGDTLVIDYEGRFLDGKFFDSTIKRNEPFYYVYGSEWQLIKGLEEVVGKMEEGEKAIAILPSELAFGNTGSTTGIVPPFTSLIFEIEIKKIN